MWGPLSVFFRMHKLSLFVFQRFFLTYLEKLVLGIAGWMRGGWEDKENKSEVETTPLTTNRYYVADVKSKCAELSTLAFLNRASGITWESNVAMPHLVIN